MIVTNIREQISNGNIHILPYDPSRTGVNSHDLTLSKHLARYTEYELDSAKDNALERFVMPKTGFVLQPNVLYLGATNEKAGSDKFVPMLEGKSSIGRLGISVHLTAGVGDIGFQNFWTLEITVEQPVKVYPNMPICQVLFHTVNEIPENLYSGNYNNQGPLPVGSRMFKNFPQKNR